MVSPRVLNVSARNPQTLVLGRFLFGISLMFQRYLGDDLLRYPETASFRDSLRDRLGSKAAYRIRGGIVVLLFSTPTILPMLHGLQQLLQHRCLELLSCINQFGLLLSFN